MNKRRLEIFILVLYERPVGLFCCFFFSFKAWQFLVQSLHFLLPWRQLPVLSYSANWEMTIWNWKIRSDTGHVYRSDKCKLELNNASLKVRKDKFELRNVDLELKMIIKKRMAIPVFSFTGIYHRRF